MESVPGHVWLHSRTDGQMHLYASPVGPDRDGIVTGLCRAEVMSFRLAEVEAGESPPACFDCLLEAGLIYAEGLARRVERRRLTWGPDVEAMRQLTDLEKVRRLLHPDP